MHDNIEGDRLWSDTENDIFPNWKDMVKEAVAKQPDLTREPDEVRICRVPNTNVHILFAMFHEEEIIYMIAMGTPPGEKAQAIG